MKRQASNLSFSCLLPKLTDKLKPFYHLWQEIAKHTGFIHHHRWNWFLRIFQSQQNKEADELGGKLHSELVKKEASLPLSVESIIPSPLPEPKRLMPEIAKLMNEESEKCLRQEIPRHFQSALDRGASFDFVVTDKSKYYHHLITTSKASLETPVFLWPKKSDT